MNVSGLPNLPKYACLEEAGEDILYLASSLNRNAQTLAASSGWPILDSGTRLKTSNFPDSTPPKPATIGVLNIPLFLCQPVRHCRDKSSIKGATAFGQATRGAKSAIPALSAIFEKVDLRCDTVDPDTSPSHLTCRTLTQPNDRMLSRRVHAVLRMTLQSCGTRGIYHGASVT